jgi:GntR family transcriptional regulator/MocR family aminotransferase
VLFPALRLGYIVVPPGLVPLFAGAKFLASGYTPTIEQRVLADLLREGAFERHLRRARILASAKRNAMVQAIGEFLGPRVSVSGADAGLHVLAWLREIRNSQVSELTKRAAAEGVGIYSVSPCFLQPPRVGGLVLGYASMTEVDIRAGIKRLATLL